MLGDWIWSPPDVKATTTVYHSLPHKGWDRIQKTKSPLVIFITDHIKKVQWTCLHHIAKFLNKSWITVGANYISSSQSNRLIAHVAPVGCSATHPLYQSWKILEPTLVPGTHLYFNSYLHEEHKGHKGKDENFYQQEWANNLQTNQYQKGIKDINTN